MNKKDDIQRSDQAAKTNVVGRINAVVSPKEKQRLDVYLAIKNESLVEWVKEKISELPEYTLKGADKETEDKIPKRKTG